MRKIISIACLLFVWSCSSKYSVLLIDQAQQTTNYIKYQGKVTEIPFADSNKQNYTFISTSKIVVDSKAKAKVGTIAIHVFNNEDVQKEINQLIIKEAALLGAKYYDIVWSKTENESSEANQLHGVVNYYINHAS
ncbi:hypothetical protein EP331_12105 [bacterium]|nr:MAG: hypothetical protein EP331_12105 [bacterium]